MEHRIGKRMPVQLDVTLAGRHGPELKGEILDLSARGAFIRLLGDSSALRSIVHLEFPLHTAKPAEYCECWALIVHTSEGGIGVMFDHLQEAAIEKLQAPGNASSLATPVPYKTTDLARQPESAVH